MVGGYPAAAVDYRFIDSTSITDRDLVFSPLKHWADDKEPPRIEWIVDGCFMPGTVTLLSSDGGLGKSLLMQQLCTAAATGRNWLGLPTRRVKSFAFFCEDDRDELWRRQARINRHYGCSMGDLEDVLYQAPVGRSNIICNFNGWDAVPEPTPLFQSIARISQRHGAQLIIIDTVSDVFGGNEIAKDQVRAFITMLRRLAIACAACIILTAHVSNEGLASGSGLSGSRAWSNSVRSRLWLTEKQKDAGGDIRYLRTMKANYGKRGEPLKLRWKDGVFVNDADQVAAQTAYMRD